MDNWRDWRFSPDTFFNLLSPHHKLSEIVASLKRWDRYFLYDINVDEIKNAEDLQEHLANYTHNDPDLPESYRFSKFLKSVESRTVEKLHNRDARNFLRNDTALLKDRLSKEDHGFDLISVYGAHKSSPHHVESTLLKYLIHRIENNDQYKQVDPETAHNLDLAFLKHHQQGQAAQKNGGLTVEHLQKFMENKGTERLANELINHRKQLHNYILENHPESIEEINGEPHIRLTRGLDVSQSERGIDHALASYADISRTGFGKHMHHQMVPLKNVWSSYDNLPKETLHENFETENEFLVSPHENIYNQNFSSSPTKPITIDDYHSLEPLEDERAVDHFASQPRVDSLRELKNKPFLHKKLYKQPDFSRKLLMRRPEWYNTIKDMFFIGKDNFDKTVKAHAHNTKILNQMPEDPWWSDEHTSLVIQQQPWPAIEKLPISKIKTEHIRQFANHIDTKWNPELAHTVYTKLKGTPQYDTFAKDNPESHELLKNGYVRHENLLASSIKKETFNLKKSSNNMKKSIHLKNEIKDLKKSIENLQKQIKLPLFLEYIEPLEKSEKLPHYLKFMGDHPKAQETAQWASDSLKHRNLAELGMRHAKTKPEGLNDEEKTQIKHFSDSLHIPEVQRAAGSLTSKHDFASGIKILENAENAYKKRHADEAPKLAPLEGDKLLDLGDGVAVYRLPLNENGKNEGEATAMGHCATPHDGGELWSIRKDHGNGMCEPMVTISHEGGYLGEIKGKHNWKPSDRHHIHIAKLMASDLVKGYVGGGYMPESNFEFSDLKEGLKKKLLEHKPSLTQKVYKEHLPEGFQGGYNHTPEIKSIFNSNDLELQLKYLETLDPSRSHHIINDIVKNPDIHPEILGKLSNHDDFNFRWQIAEHPNTPPGILHKLSGDPDSSVRWTIAAHPNTPPEALRELSRDPSSFVREGIAKNPNTPPETLRELSGNTDSTLRWGVAGNPNTPPEILGELSNHDDPLTRWKIAENPNTLPETLGKLLKINAEEYELRSRLTGNPNTPPETLRELSGDPDSHVRDGVARHPNTPPDALRELSRDPHIFVRGTIAANPNTPPEILGELSRDPESHVRRSIVKNPKTPLDLEILRELSGDRHNGVREEIVKNPNTPLEILHKLSGDPHKDVRGGVARHPNTPPEILRELSRDPDSFVRGTIAANPNTPPEILGELSRDPDSFVRDGVARHPNTPPESLPARPLANTNIQKIIAMINNFERSPNDARQAMEELKIRRKEKYDRIFSPEGDLNDLLHLAESHDQRFKERARKELKRRGLLKSLNKSIKSSANQKLLPQKAKGCVKRMKKSIHLKNEIKDLKKSLHDQLEKAGITNKIKAGLVGLGALAAPAQYTSLHAVDAPPSKPYVEEQAKWAEDEGRLKPGDKLESYLDPRHLPVEEHYEDKYGLPRRSITAIRLAGERSNWSASSSAKTRSPYQFTAHSRKLYMDKYGVDAWEDTINSIHATALHLVESRKWAKNKFKLKNEHDIAVKASQHFHAGPNVLEKWGPINKDYGLRYNIGLLHLQNNPSAENLEHLFNGKKVKKQYFNEQGVDPSKLQMSVKDEIKDLKKSIASLQEKIK